jgi:hypothetical protein
MSKSINEREIVEIIELVRTIPKHFQEPKEKNKNIILKRTKIY